MFIIKCCYGIKIITVSSSRNIVFLRPSVQLSSFKNYKCYGSNMSASYVIASALFYSLIVVSSFVWYKYVFPKKQRSQNEGVAAVILELHSHLKSIEQKKKIGQ